MAHTVLKNILIYISKFYCNRATLGMATFLSLSICLYFLSILLLSIFQPQNCCRKRLPFLVSRDFDNIFDSVFLVFLFFIPLFFLYSFNLFSTSSVYLCDRVPHTRALSRPARQLAPTFQTRIGLVEFSLVQIIYIIHVGVWGGVNVSDDWRNLKVGCLLVERHFLFFFFSSVIFWSRREGLW